MNLEFILKYLPLYEKAAWLTIRIGFAGMALAVLMGLACAMIVISDTIAPAVTRGNTTLLDWINQEIETLGEEQFFHADYEATLTDTYGLDYEDSLVVEGGKAGE